MESLWDPVGRLKRLSSDISKGLQHQQGKVDEHASKNKGKQAKSKLLSLAFFIWAAT